MTAATRWLVPDGWMPPRGTADVEGHEAVCLLNTGDRPARVTLTFFFEDAEPVAVEGLGCDARRTRHFRLDRPEEIGGYELPAETPYALVVDSDVPITVQHTRVDTRATALTLMTTMAVPSEVVS
ncbi:sensory rhodopsin transducer [Micromonospora sp. NPDC005113]